MLGAEPWLGWSTPRSCPRPQIVREIARRRSLQRRDLAPQRFGRVRPDERGGLVAQAPLQRLGRQPLGEVERRLDRRRAAALDPDGCAGVPNRLVACDRDLLEERFKWRNAEWRCLTRWFGVG